MTSVARHCYIFSEGHPKLVEMPLGRAQQVVDDCVEMCRRMERLPYFYITGGDPILHSRFVACQDRTLNEAIGKLNIARFDRSHLAGNFVSKEQPSIIDDPSIRSGFYGAPTVITIFGPKRFLYSVPDAFCAAENMVLEATALGLASCILARGEETFDNPEGEKILQSWNIPDTMVARCFVILGYIDGDYPASKPRKEGRFVIIK